MTEIIQFFADRLLAAVGRCQTPLVVGIDPRFDQLPPELKRGIVSGDWNSIASSCGEFSRGIIDAVAGLVPAVKIQVAFFEALGPAGMTTLANVIDHASASGLIVILDGKRTDIGSTAEAYAEAWLGRRPHSPWNCDALTVNPYMGNDSLAPFRDRSLKTGSGIFVLVKTSNPGSNHFQELDCGGQKLYQAVGRHVHVAHPPLVVRKRHRVIDGRDAGARVSLVGIGNGEGQRKVHTGPRFDLLLQRVAMQIHQTGHEPLTFQVDDFRALRSLLRFYSDDAAVLQEQRRVVRHAIRQDDLRARDAGQPGSHGSSVQPASEPGGKGVDTDDGDEHHDDER